MCDPAALVRLLTADPTKAAAWAGVLGDRTGRHPVRTSPGSLPSSCAPTPPSPITATRAVRRRTFRRVLQAGTAVLVDDRGVPVVRCASGNPLTAPPIGPRALRGRELGRLHAGLGRHRDPARRVRRGVRGRRRVGRRRGPARRDDGRPRSPVPTRRGSPALGERRHRERARPPGRRPPPRPRRAETAPCPPTRDRTAPTTRSTARAPTPTSRPTAVRAPAPRRSSARTAAGPGSSTGRSRSRCRSATGVSAAERRPWSRAERPTVRWRSARRCRLSTSPTTCRRRGRSPPGRDRTYDTSTHEGEFSARWSGDLGTGRPRPEQLPVTIRQTVAPRSRLRPVARELGRPRRLLVRVRRRSRSAGALSSGRRSVTRRPRPVERGPDERGIVAERGARGAGVPEVLDGHPAVVARGGSAAKSASKSTTPSSNGENQGRAVPTGVGWSRTSCSSRARARGTGRAPRARCGSPRSPRTPCCRRRGSPRSNSGSNPSTRRRASDALGTIVWWWISTSARTPARRASVLDQPEVVAARLRTPRCRSPSRHRERQARGPAARRTPRRTATTASTASSSPGGGYAPRLAIVRPCAAGEVAGAAGVGERRLERAAVVAPEARWVVAQRPRDGGDPPLDARRIPASAISAAASSGVRSGSIAVKTDSRGVTAGAPPVRSTPGDRERVRAPGTSSR